MSEEPESTKRGIVVVSYTIKKERMNEEGERERLRQDHRVVFKFRICARKPMVSVPEGRIHNLNDRTQVKSGRHLVFLAGESFQDCHRPCFCARTALLTQGMAPATRAICPTGVFSGTIFLNLPNLPGRAHFAPKE